MSEPRGFSTLGLRPDHRVSRWTQAVSDRFVASGFAIGTPQAFDAAMLNRDLADLSITRFRSQGHGRKLITRSTSQATRAGEEFFLLTLQLEGRGAVRQAEREVWLAPGEFALCDTRRPYELDFDTDYRQTVVRVPRRDLVGRLAGCDALVAARVGADTLPARMLRRMLDEACVAAPQTCRSAQAAHDLADALLDVAAAGLRGLRDGAPMAHAGASQLARAHVLMRARLGDPALTIRGVAADIGVSVRRLHQLFRADGCTPERWLWAQRLCACERALRDPARAGDTLTRIAYDNGFSDAAHFSRAFSRRYGRSPLAHRRAAERA